MALLMIPNRVETRVDAGEAYPTKTMALVNVSTLSSKTIRQDLANDDEMPTMSSRIF